MFILFLVILGTSTSVALYLATHQKPERKMPYTAEELDQVEQELGIPQPEKALRQSTVAQMTTRAGIRFYVFTCYKCNAQSSGPTPILAQNSHRCKPQPIGVQKTWK